MLVLDLRVLEGVRVGPEVTIKFLSVRKGHVKIGITAPRILVIERLDHNGQPKPKVNLD